MSAPRNDEAAKETRSYWRHTWLIVDVDLPQNTPPTVRAALKEIRESHDALLEMALKIELLASNAPGQGNVAPVLPPTAKPRRVTSRGALVLIEGGAA